MKAKKFTYQRYSAEEKKLVEAPLSEYMCDAQLSFFRNRLIELHDATKAHINSAKQQMIVPQDLSDHSDRATWEEQCSISMRIVEREQKLLPKIQQALERIRLGTYGYCLDSGEPIGIPRLLIRPTAEYCADVKDYKEAGEHLYRD